MFARGAARFARQFGRIGARSVSSARFPTARIVRWGVASTSVLAVLSVSQMQMKADDINYDDVRKTIAALLEQPSYDDGSLGPVLIRLAWHAAGTYDIKDGSGGSNGATMRFKPESEHGANAGLNVARDLLEKVKAQYPGISYADLWTLAGAVAVEEMGGPRIPWKPGRSDATSGDACPPQGRLPDADKGANHLRDIFYKMGFNDKEIVALAGAHCFGRCHTNRSGYTGPWTRAPTTFSNLFYKELLENKWTPKNWKGPLQYEDPTGQLMMTPADMSIVNDPVFRKYAEAYAADEKLFEKDFAKAFGKLLGLGVPSYKENSLNWQIPLLVAGVAGAAGIAYSQRKRE